MRKPVALSVALLLVAFLAACSPSANQPGGGTAVAPGLPVLSAASFTSGEAFESLPPGDLLITLDAGTLLNATIPAALAGSPEDRAKFDKGLQEMQQEAGIDPKQLKLVALSFVYPKGPGDQAEFAGIMTGSFDTAKLTESLKKDPKTGVENQTEQYNGQTLYIKKDGSEEIASAVLDSGTVVIGSPAARVHMAIDAHAKATDNATKDAPLFSAFKSTDPASILRFAMRFPKERVPAEQAAKDPMTKSFTAINYVTGSLNATAGLGLNLTAKTGSPADAQPLHDNLQQLLDMGKKQLGSDEGMKNFASVLNATSITVNGSDVQLVMNVPPDQLAALATDFQKMGAAFGGAMGGSTGSGTGSRPSGANANTNSDDQ